MIREMRKSDWKSVSEIYKRGLEAGTSTFNTECPSYDDWNNSHAERCRFVYEENGTVAGWIALTPSSSICAYRGCAEMSIYLAPNFQGKGIGPRLVNKLLDEAEKAGYWTIYSSIISINAPSIALHKKCGFREIGYMERIARDRFGSWQNVTLMEYRIPDTGKSVTP